MKHYESMQTETTKQSLIQVSNQIANKQQFVKVFMNLGNRTIFVSFPLLSKTISNLIFESLLQAKQSYCHELQVQPEKYVVFAARRNGNKIRDYPSLDENQNILLTNLKFYCLSKKSQDIKEKIYPLSQIVLNLQKKEQKKVKQNSTCFCIF